MKSAIIFVFIASFAAGFAFNERNELYRGNQLLRVSCEYEDDAKWLHELEESHSQNLDFWTGAVIGRSADVMVAPDYIHEFQLMLQERKLSYGIVNEDVQDDVNREQHLIKMHRLTKRDVDVSSFEDFNYTIYHDYDEIQQWVSDITAEYSGFVNNFTFGYSFEGREIRALEITAPAAIGATNPKPIVYFEGGIHAREWVSPATVMYFTAKFLRKYVEGDEDAMRMLGMYDFHIVPCLNVDGYAFTWTNERLWRKSRQLNPDFGCVGTDLNRNFNKFWGGNGASPWPCSITFRGFTDLDHSETMAIENHFQKLKAENRDTKVFIDWHSYSQLILAPWSYSAEVDPPADYDKQRAAAGAMAKAMNETNNVPGGYIHGTSTEILYESSGSSKDYGYAGTPDATYSYTVELRDTGEYGFILPPDQIQPTGEESYYGVIAMLDWIILNDY